MAKFRKKPVVIEAFQWDHAKFNSDLTQEIPNWFLHAIVRQDCKDSDTIPAMLMLKTREGWMQCPTGHWIIQGVAGEIYSCAPEIFEATYEKVEN